MARFMTAGLRTYPGYHRKSAVSLDKLGRARLAAWVQSDSYSNKTDADVIINYAKAHDITDLYLLVAYPGTPNLLMGYAGSCNTHLWGTTADGSYMFDYMVRNCAPLGIRCHAWWCMMFWSWYGDTSKTFMNTPLSDTYKDLTSYSATDGYNWKMFDATARTTVVNVLWDFAHNNRMCEGVQLDYIRTNGNSTAHTTTDITNLVGDVRTKMPDRHISVCSIGTVPNGKINDRQDVVDFVSHKYVDSVAFMGYFWCFARKLELANQFNYGTGGVEVYWGQSAEPYRTNPSDVAHNTRWIQQRGWKNFALFDMYSTHFRAAEYANYVDGININCNLETYGDIADITKISHVNGTSWTVTIGGSDYTTLYSAVTDHTEAGYLKDHVEGVEGARGPMMYVRLGDTTTYITAGDWYP